MKQHLYNLKKEKVGEVELSDAIFSQKPNQKLLYEAVKMERANLREGSAATKNRALVSGSTRKIYRQKGTGRARHSSVKAHIFVGGGIAFGPMPRDYSYAIPKKARRGALASALALKRAEERLIVVDELKVPEVKTKRVAEILKNLGVDTGLIVTDHFDEKFVKSARNIPGIEVVGEARLGVADVLRHNYLIVTAAPLKRLEERVTA